MVVVTYVYCPPLVPLRIAVCAIKLIYEIKYELVSTTNTCFLYQEKINYGMAICLRLYTYFYRLLPGTRNFHPNCLCFMDRDVAQASLLWINCQRQCLSWSTKYD